MPASRAESCPRVPPSHPETGEEWAQQHLEQWKALHLEELKNRHLNEWKSLQLEEWKNRRPEGRKNPKLEEEQWRKQKLDDCKGHQDESWKQMTPRDSEGTLPMDPRQWTREHVQLWLRRSATRHGLAVRASRFLMNGKALCLMTPEMYERRVPAGGALLHSDFRRRLAHALRG